MYTCFEHNWISTHYTCRVCNPIQYLAQSEGTQSIFFKEPTECIQVTVEDYEKLVEYKQKYEDLVKAINTLKNVSWP